MTRGWLAIAAACVATGAACAATGATGAQALTAPASPAGRGQRAQAVAPARPGSVTPQAASVASPSASASAATAPASAPILRTIWQAAFDPDAFRIAVGDTVGDGVQRIVAVSAPGGRGARLTVYRWSGSAYAPEWSTDLGEGQGAIAVGRFEAGEPAARIVTMRGWFAWDGAGYARREFPRPVLPVGVVRGRDGTDTLLLRDGGDFRACQLDPSAADPLVTVEPPADDARTAWGVLRAAPAELAAALPPEYALGGVMGLMEWPGLQRPARVLARWQTTGDGAGGAVVLVRELGGEPLREIGRGPAFQGRIVDLAFGDLRDRGETGIVALVANPSGRARTLVVLAPTTTRSAGARPAR
ncbi:MAG TPA: hypothetical protein VLH79_08120 [Chthonomonadales bacterium]|nr:hypothetical protein [Chthonomonadales bacterium]